MVRNAILVSYPLSTTKAEERRWVEATVPKDDDSVWEEVAEPNQLFSSLSLSLSLSLLPFIPFE
jgi:hypothetical protein